MFIASVRLKPKFGRSKTKFDEGVPEADPKN